MRILAVPVEQPKAPAAEQRLRTLLQSGAFPDATEETLRVYGPEILSFLHARFGNMQRARDAFAWAAEDIWRGLPRFRGESSVRTWAYAVARNAARRYVERELKGDLYNVPLSELSQRSALAVQLPTSHTNEDRLQSIRGQLDEEEQLLLTLRIDRNMDWRDVARVVTFEGQEETDDELLERETARLRKRFQLLKDKLRKLLRESI